MAKQIKDVKPSDTSKASIPKELERLRENLAPQSQSDEDPEKARLNRELYQEQIQTLREKNLDKKSNRELRWKYASWVYFYLVIYSLACLILLFLAGFEISDFDLPESVLSYLVGSTAVSAIGLVLAVTHGLFKQPPE